MAGANYSTKVRKWTHAGANSAADLGQVFIAVDPNCFAPDFEDRMVDFNCRLRGCKPVNTFSYPNTYIIHKIIFIVYFLHYYRLTPKNL